MRKEFRLVGECRGMSTFGKISSLNSDDSKYELLTICILLGIKSMNKNKEGSQVAHVANETKDVHLMVIVGRMI